MTRGATPLTESGRDLDDLRCCNRCQEWLKRNEDNFFNDKDGPLGYSRTCKPCDRARQTQRREDIRMGRIVPKPNNRRKK